MQLCITTVKMYGEILLELARRGNRHAVIPATKSDYWKYSITGFFS